VNYVVWIIIWIIFKMMKIYEVFCYLENFKLHLKPKNFKFLHCYNFSIFACWSSNFPKFSNWPLDLSKFCSLTPQHFWYLKIGHIFNFQIWPKKIKFIKVVQKLWQWNFYYSIQTKILKNKNNLNESFKLSTIVNSLNFLNYFIQTNS